MLASQRIVIFGPVLLALTKAQPVLKLTLTPSIVFNTHLLVSQNSFICLITSNLTLSGDGNLISGVE